MRSMWTTWGLRVESIFIRGVCCQIEAARKSMIEGPLVLMLRAISSPRGTDTTVPLANIPDHEPLQLLTRRVSPLENERSRQKRAVNFLERSPLFLEAGWSEQFFRARSLGAESVEHSCSDPQFVQTKWTRG